MKITKKIAYVLFSLMVSPGLFAANYYLSTSGSDSNNGGSSSSPWKTVSKLNQQTLSPGDNVYFRRGDRFRDSETVKVNRSGTSSQPITYRSYGSGDRPIIDVYREVSGSGSSGRWRNDGNNVWSIDDVTRDPRRLLLSGQEYVEAEGSINRINSQYRWWYDGNNNRLYVYSTNNPATKYANVKGLQDSPYGIHLVDKDYITIRDIEFRGGDYAAIGGYGCQFVEVIWCTIYQSRHGIVFAGIQSGNIGSRNITIRECWIDAGADFEYDYEWNGLGDGIGFWDEVRDSTIRGNTIKNWGHTGVNFMGAEKGFVYGVSNNHVYDNFITSSNIPYGRGFALAGVQNKCRYNRFYRNEVKDTTVRNQINGNDNFIYENKIENVRTSPVYAGTRDTAQAFHLQGYGHYLDGYDPFVCHRNKIYDNTIRNCDEPGIVLAGNSGDHWKYDNEIYNNDILNTGQNPYSSSSKDCGIQIEGSSSDYTVGDNVYRYNKIWNSNGRHRVRYRGQIKSVSEFNATNGSNGDVIFDNYN